jgi:stage II sporulation protein P
MKDTPLSREEVIRVIEGKGAARRVPIAVQQWIAPEIFGEREAEYRALLEDYPTLMRPLLLRASRYNQHATTGSLLVEVGAAGNSPEEAAVAARLFAEGLVNVLQA